MALHKKTHLESSDYLDVIDGDSAGEVILVPHGDLILTADYVRSVSDLILVRGDGAQVVLENFFNHEGDGKLQTTDGAEIPFELAKVLAGPVAPGQFAQVSENSTKLAIGSIEKIRKTRSVSPSTRMPIRNPRHLTILQTTRQQKAWGNLQTKPKPKNR